MKRYLIANWKMNLPEESVDEYFRALGSWPLSSTVDVVVAPPFTLLGAAATIARVLPRPVSVAAQNCSDKAKGAFTGEIASSMIAGAGAEYAIVGHSERRHIFGESDEIVGAKLRASLEASVKPILCVGEKEEVRESGGTVELLEAQLRAALAASSPPADSMLIAYEPVWAIGTGRNATPSIVEETHSSIARITRDLLGWVPPILYGGSVSPDNAGELGATRGVDGFLVGGASLSSSKFRGIYDALEASV